MSQEKVASISVSGILTLNMHSLNNEGGEGNQTITRQLTVLDNDGEKHTVTGISGDMFKHIHTHYLINYATENDLVLCTNCKVFNPNRLSTGEDLADAFEGQDDYKDAEVVDKINEKCVVDDLEGVLVTSIGSKNKNIPRKSVSEFGWIVGIPEKNNTESYLHTKFVPDSGTQREEDRSNEGQNIFHRPANYGDYAFVCNFDVYRIGFNDMKRQYSIDQSDRTKRYKALLQSLLHSFIDTKGAMISAQKPHFVDFQGAITYTTQLTPAPTVSPMNKNFKGELESIKDSLNKIEGDGAEVVHYLPFENISGFVEKLSDVIDKEPYQIKTEHEG